MKLLLALLFPLALAAPDHSAHQGWAAPPQQDVVQNVQYGPWVPQDQAWQGYRYGPTNTFFFFVFMYYYIFDSLMLFFIVIS